MPATIDTDALAALLRDDPRVQLVEVLPESEYDQEHLPGARSIPLMAMTPERADKLDRALPVVAYCFDYQ